MLPMGYAGFWLAGEHETGSPWPRAEFCFKLGISSGTHTASFSCFSGETLKAAELCLVWPSKRRYYWQLLLNPRRGLDLSPQRAVTLVGCQASPGEMRHMRESQLDARGMLVTFTWARDCLHSFSHSPAHTLVRSSSFFPQPLCANFSRENAI